MSIELKKAVANLSSEDLLASTLFLSGFELEFQSCNGKKYSNDDECELDTEAAWEDLIERIRNGNFEIRLGQLSYVYSQLAFTDEVNQFFLGASGLSLSSLSRKIKEINDSSLTDEGLLLFVRTTLPEALAQLTTALESVGRADLEDFIDIYDYYSSSDFPLESDDSILNAEVKNIEMKYDSSVSGGEIIVKKPTTPSLCLEIANQLFSENKFNIDTGCSFHIHLSVPGISHTYGQAFQSELYLYILSQWARVPESVRERWKRSLDYCRLNLSQEKYTFVHYHQGYRTWEFRCFGNVSTTADATACYQLALEAMRHAYAVSLQEKKAILSPFATQNTLFQDFSRMISAGRFDAGQLNASLGNVSLAG